MRYGDPHGSADVKVTVWPNHHIEVSLLNHVSPAFDQSFLEAWQAMDRKDILEYPVGSTRGMFSYSMKGYRASAASGMPEVCRTVTGDKESQLRQW